MTPLLLTNRLPETIFHYGLDSQRSNGESTVVVRIRSRSHLRPRLDSTTKTGETSPVTGVLRKYTTKRFVTTQRETDKPLKIRFPRGKDLK